MDSLMGGDVTTPDGVRDLTGEVRREGRERVAMGGYSSVWRTVWQPKGTAQIHEVVIKLLHTSHSDKDAAQRKLLKRLKSEIRVWSRLKHENIVSFLGYTQEDEGPGLISSWYSHGSVRKFLKNNPHVNREVLCADVALGLDYLHSYDPQIIHGDLKGENVLIGLDGRACLCDFGLSVILDGTSTGYTSSNLGGSLRFLAPELLDDTVRTVYSDVYAYACTCIEILFDKEPYQELSMHAHIIRAIMDRRPPHEITAQNVLVTMFSLDVLALSWQPDPSARPALKDIIKIMRLSLYKRHRANVELPQAIGRSICVTSPDGAQHCGTLVSIANDRASFSLQLTVDRMLQIPMYHRYCWEFIEAQVSAANSSMSLPTSQTRPDQPIDSLSSESYKPLRNGLQETDQMSAENTASVHGLLSRLGWRSYSSKFRLSLISVEPKPATILASWDFPQVREDVALETISEFPYTPYGVEAGEHSPEVPTILRGYRNLDITYPSGSILNSDHDPGYSHSVTRSRGRPHLDPTIGSPDVHPFGVGNRQRHSSDVYERISNGDGTPDDDTTFLELDDHDSSRGRQYGRQRKDRGKTDDQVIASPTQTNNSHSHPPPRSSPIPVPRQAVREPSRASFTQTPTHREWWKA